MQDRSRNGTYLNGSPLRPGAPAVLSSGDVLSLVLCVNPLTQLCFVFEECPVPPPNWTRAANAQEGAGSSAQSGNTAVRRPTATGGDALGAGGAAGAAAGAAPYPVLPVGLPRASGNLNAALSAAAVAAALAAGRGTSRNSRGHRAGRSNRSPAAAATSTAGTETLGLVDPLAAAAPHRLSGTGFSEGGVEQWPSGAGPREVTSPQPSLPPASLPQSPDRRRITRWVGYLHLVRLQVPLAGLTTGKRVRQQQTVSAIDSPVLRCVCKVTQTAYTHPFATQAVHGQWCASLAVA